MVSGSSTLTSRLRQVAWRLWTLGTTASAIWGLFAAVLLWLAGAWLDLLWEMPPELRLATWAVAALGATVAIGAVVWRTTRSTRAATIAFRVDRSAGAGGQIVTGYDLQTSGLGVPNPEHASLSRYLADLATDRAATLAGEVHLSHAVPMRPLVRPLAMLFAVVGVIILIVILLPGLATTQWSRFVQPFDDVPPFNPIHFEVEPGDVAVLYGNRLDVFARPEGGPVDEVAMVLQAADGSMERLPIFPESDGRWRAVLERVTDEADYFVSVHRARSPRFHIDVINVPQIEEVRLTISPPRYTREPIYDGPLPRDGITGLPGTKVVVRARSNRTLSGGELVIRSEASTNNVAMKCDDADPYWAGGQFEIDHDGSFEFRLIDVDGVLSTESFSGAITVLADQRPFVRLTEPKRFSLATPQATLPISIDAEDDYGIAQLQLFRSLNASRALPTDIALDDPPPRRHYDSMQLRLYEYGLQPGDEIRLFARVEDNNPAVTQGAESEVVTVRIISQEEFERMVRAREGLQTLLSKYREAQRRLESLAAEIEKLRKQLAEADPKSKASEDLRKKLQALLQKLKQQGS